MECARLCVCLGVVLALWSASVAQADIAPVPKPDGPVTPLIKPKAQKPKQQPVTLPPTTPLQPVVARTTASTTSHAQVRTSPPRPVSTSGGREQPVLPPVAAGGGRHASASLPARIVELFPTKLAEVGNDSLPAYSSWPSWVLAAFTLLASAEAFLLVRIARARRYAQGERLRELADH